MPAHISDSLRSLLLAMLAKNPIDRPTVEAMRAHPWVSDGKLPGAGAADQGSFDAALEVGDDRPTYRGLGEAPKSFDDHMIVDEDDAPVYRSLGGAIADAPPTPTPGLVRQRAASTLTGMLSLPDEPASGFAALDALMEEQGIA